MESHLVCFISLTARNKDEQQQKQTLRNREYQLYKYFILSCFFIFVLIGEDNKENNSCIGDPVAPNILEVRPTCLSEYCKYSVSDLDEMREGSRIE